LKNTILAVDQKVRSNLSFIEWNDTVVDSPAKTVLQLFEKQVRKTLHNIAVVYEDHELNYEQLNKKANQLVNYLRAQGVGPDTLVAIAGERAPEMIIDLLAILKAGGAYVLLDPAYPEYHMQFKLKDTKAPLLITQAHLKEKFKNYTGKTLSLQLDTETKDLFMEGSPVSDLSPSSQVWTNLSTRDSQDLPPLSIPRNLMSSISQALLVNLRRGMIQFKSLINFIISLRAKIDTSLSDKFFAAILNAKVKEEALHLAWTYSQNCCSLEALPNVSFSFMQRLKQLINHCCQDHNFGYTPSDFDFSGVPITNRINTQT
jgi:hypothetical protein